MISGTSGRSRRPCRAHSCPQPVTRIGQCPFTLAPFCPPLATESLIYQHKLDTHLSIPLTQWDVLWLTDKCRLGRLRSLGIKAPASNEPAGGKSDERSDPAGNLRFLPPERPCRVDLR